MANIYADHKRAHFPPGTKVRKHGGFYVTKVRTTLPGFFEIVAEVDDHMFRVVRNLAIPNYDDLTDLLEWTDERFR